MKPQHELGPTGSAPAHLKDAFHEIASGIGEYTVDDMNELVDVEGEMKPWSWLFAQLWNCTDKAPQEISDIFLAEELEGHVRLTYAELVRIKAYEDDLMDAEDDDDRARYNMLMAEAMGDLPEH